MNKYQITLTPTGRFFFGGDMTFTRPKESENDRHNEEFSSYIIRSNYIPQQTSLLGMLRFLLLSNSAYFCKGKQTFKNYNEDLGAVNRLIGPKSFSVNQDGAESDFGAIKQLSNCVIQIRVGDIDKWYTLHPAEPAFTRSFNFEGSTQATLNGRIVTIPSAPDYKAKDGFEAEYEFLQDVPESESNAESGKTKLVRVKLSDIFVEDRRVGISKNYKGDVTDKSALFKQISYRFNNQLFTYGEDGEKIESSTQKCKYRFAFEAVVENSPVDIATQAGSLVSVGADSSNFVLGVDTSIQDDNFTYEANHNRIILQSPAMLDQEVVATASFAIAKTIPFRFMKTRSVEERQATILKRDENKYYLFAEGSIFYFVDNNDSQAKFEEALKANECLSQIGYNKFVSIKK